MSTPDRPPPAGRKPAQPSRQAALRFGLSAESRAAALLIAKGYRVLARRFKTPVGEIDIVARRRGALVFVEVKARETFDAAAEALTARQQARIIDAAQYWPRTRTRSKARSVSMRSWSHPERFPATSRARSMQRRRAAEAA